ncbi:MAG: nucleotidyl transferase AbiEii/AbiGii toxin family protein [Candidatus Parvarchaeota archaeon]|jgi:hypothetical protein|nr:nucleotidyl transferase AbiEii/AbiGii toxin family protein [Candidatus Parvarchaeota archaeon]MCL5106833.1 nucleotidyl transferase AbiEii/AbiGii toxin family protein [Candidatus Parvarchaeota archaeon]
MISGTDLLLYRSHFITVRHLEKDYLQTLVLNEIYSDFSSDLVFKGGTALQKVYGLDRFSEDLDFTFNGEKDYKSRLDRALKRVADQYSFNLHSHPSEKDSITIELRNMQGPLYPLYKATNTLKLDISLREHTISSPELKYIVPIYPDLKQFSVYVMSLDEMLAEKVRAIYSRTKSRDLYYIYFILNRNKLSFDFGIISKKLGDVNFSKKTFEDKIEAIGTKLWKKELSQTIVNLPDYDTVVRYVKGTLRKSILN